MKASTFLVLSSFLSGSAVSAAAVPEDSHAQHVGYSTTPSVFERDLDTTKDLWKRKGGGRGGGGGSGSGSSSGGSRTSPSSNTGGRTRMGSGPPPPYSAGTYSGGAKVPQQAGKSFPATRIAPFLLLGGAGALAFWPGVWLYGAYMYPYHHHWSYRNRTSNRNETTPVLCGCARFELCACEENNNQTFIDSTVGTGSADDLRQRNVAVADVNGTRTILINGTLPNGTTAAGGEDDDDDSGAVRILHTLGYWPVIITVMAAVLAV